MFRPHRSRRASTRRPRNIGRAQRCFATRSRAGWGRLWSEWTREACQRCLLRFWPITLFENVVEVREHA